MYEAGELKAVAYKNGEQWAENVVQTTGEAFSLKMEVDRDRITADGKDLAFVTVKVTDREGRMVPDAAFPVRFIVEGPGEIVATDNGDPSDMLAFPSSQRNTFSGKCLAIVRGKVDEPGIITIKALSPGLRESSYSLTSE